MSDIQLSKVSKVYPPDVMAVKAIDLHIKQGEFFILLGPSGCGKSTTLRLIAGLEEISEGQLHIGGKAMTHVDPAQRDLALVFQNYALYPHMTVAKNLGFGLKLRGVASNEIKRRITDASKVLDIEKLLARKPRELSGGQQQRVALGRALVRDPVAFLLDEPLSNLDTTLRAHMRTELIKLHSRMDKTIVHVTHDHIEAMTMGDRICIMNDGRIDQIGAPMEVYRNPANTFVAGFLASPPMNMIPARLESRSGALYVVTADFSLLVPDIFNSAYQSYINRDVIFGFRPEDLQCADSAVTTQSIAVETVAVETLGPEVILVGSLPDDTEIYARMARDFRQQRGVVQHLIIDMHQAHLFDPDTTQLVARPDVSCMDTINPTNTPTNNE